MHSLLALLTDDQRAALTVVAESILAKLGADADAERRVCRLCDLDACGRSRGLCPAVATRGSKR
jgi:hypothetical protein